MLALSLWLKMLPMKLQELPASWLLLLHTIYCTLLHSAASVALGSSFCLGIEPRPESATQTTQAAKDSWNLCSLSAHQCVKTLHRNQRGACRWVLRQPHIAGFCVYVRLLTAALATATGAKVKVIWTGKTKHSQNKGRTIVGKCRSLTGLSGKCYAEHWKGRHPKIDLSQFPHVFP